MKYPRDILVLFAMLDVFVVGRFVNNIRVPELAGQAPVWFSALIILRPVLLLSLIASAFGLATQRKWGFVVSYVQFPLRFVCVWLSFGFLTLIPGLFISGHKYQPVILAAMVLECVRLVWTILIHRRISRASS